MLPREMDLSLGAADPTRGRGFKLTATVPVDHYDA